MFRHEDFGGQLLWALERGVVINRNLSKIEFLGLVVAMSVTKCD